MDTGMMIGRLDTGVVTAGGVNGRVVTVGMVGGVDT